jgi:hypothetical protein
MLDNYATYKTPGHQDLTPGSPPLRPALQPDRIDLANLVERWFAEPTNKQIRRSVQQSFQTAENAAPGSPPGTPDPKPYVWTRTADEILEPCPMLLRRPWS